jgi:hypothetical protein
VVVTVTIRWFTDEDREDMRRDKEARLEMYRVLDELYASDAQEATAAPMTREELKRLTDLQLRFPLQLPPKGDATTQDDS